MYRVRAPDRRKRRDADDAQTTWAARAREVDDATDATVQLRGRDRWGQKLDTMYESVGYLRDAIPVLRRSVNDAQAAALDKLAGELAPRKK